MPTSTPHTQTSRLRNVCTVQDSIVTIPYTANDAATLFTSKLVVNSKNGSSRKLVSWLYWNRVGMVHKNNSNFLRAKPFNSYSNSKEYHNDDTTNTILLIHYITNTLFSSIAILTYKLTMNSSCMCRELKCYWFLQTIQQCSYHHLAQWGSLCCGLLRRN